MSTAAVMCRFTVGSLSRVKFGLGGGGVLQVLQTDVAELIDDFCGLQIFAVNTPELFRCVYISICVYFDLRTFPCTYFCQVVYCPYTVCAVLLVVNRHVLSFVTNSYLNGVYQLHNTTHSPL
jgi:hypothetical protein